MLGHTCAETNEAIDEGHNEIVLPQSETMRSGPAASTVAAAWDAAGKGNQKSLIVLHPHSRRCQAAVPREGETPRTRGRLAWIGPEQSTPPPIDGTTGGGLPGPEDDWIGVGLSD